MCFVCLGNNGNASVNRHIEYYGKEGTAKLESFSLSAGSANYAAANGGKGQYTDTLLDSSAWNKTPGTPVTISYSFNINAISDTSVVYGGSTYNFSAAQQQATLGIFSMISDFTNITFVQASNASAAQLYFYMGMEYGLGAHGQAAGLNSYMYDHNNVRTISAVGMSNDYANFTPGTYAYTTLLHEIGHALGLKHPGDYYDGEEDGPYLPTNLDNSSTTVMTYNDTFNNTTYAWLDIEALQYLYGVKGNSNSGLGEGNDYYAITGNAELVYGGLGSDTIVGGTGNDTIYGGRAQADTLDSADHITGGAGNDLIFSNSGHDTVYGEAGNDTIYGGLGDDSIYGGDGDDYLAGGGGIEHPQDQSDQIWAGNGNDYVIANGGDDTVYGEAGSDTIYGGLGNDAIYGGDGNDWIFGQHGNDMMSGGAGADIFTFNSGHGADWITDFQVGVDKIRLVGNLNNSGINTVQDIMSRISDLSGNWGSSIDLGGGNYLDLQNVMSSQLSIHDFQII